MGRERVTLKRIEEKLKRQVTFSKRRTGLVKKAHEISLLCDADVALIVFSATGKLSHFSTNGSMERILETYERCSYEERVPTTFNNESYESCTMQHDRLKSRMELLQKAERHIMGEDIDSLNVKELQNLEQQLDMALKHIRLRQNQAMLESISTLQKKDKELQNQQNSLLKKKIIGFETESVKAWVLKESKAIFLNGQQTLKSGTLSGVTQWQKAITFLQPNPSERSPKPGPEEPSVSGKTHPNSP